MWILFTIGLVVGGFIGMMIGVLYMKQANDEYKQKLEKALRESQAPYEVVAPAPRYESMMNQEVKRDDNVWW